MAANGMPTSVRLIFLPPCAIVLSLEKYSSRIYTG
jgi:hypothetical protein